MKRIILSILMLSLFACVTTGSLTPLPENMKIVPPGHDVPPQIAAYSGIWDGKWDGRLDGTIVIEKITLNEVIAIYSYGSMPEWRISAGWVRVKGEVKDNSIILKWTANTTGYNYKVNLTLNNEGKIDAEYQSSRGVVSYATFKKRIGN